MKKLYAALKQRSLSPEQEEVIAEELYDDRQHRLPDDEWESENGSGNYLDRVPETIYQYFD